MTQLTNPTNYKEAREDFRSWLIEYTHCEIQEGENGKAYPCGTCVTALFKSIGVNSENPEYDEHNEKVDRLNEIHRAILQLRDTKL
ncbi:MAG: hypothetical protein HQ536_05175 [Parcubacteria group bacterium]|nr:hypothetical protein [Parcubacteria group bacterium]